MTLAREIDKYIHLQCCVNHHHIMSVDSQQLLLKHSCFSKCDLLTWLLLSPYLEGKKTLEINLWGQARPACDLSTTHTSTSPNTC